MAKAQKNTMTREIDVEVFNREDRRWVFERFVIEIDVQELTKQLARSAYQNKSKRSTIADGAVIVSVAPMPY